MGNIGGCCDDEEVRESKRVKWYIFPQRSLSFYRNRGMGWTVTIEMLSSRWTARFLHHEAVVLNYTYLMRWGQLGIA